MSGLNNLNDLPCKECKVRPAEADYIYRLCSECRKAMINRPYPAWIKAFLAIIVVLILVSSYSLPSALEAGFALRTAKKAEAGRDYPAAIAQYQKILVLFPESQKYQARLAICYLHANDTIKAIPLIQALDEKKLPNSLIDELNGLIEKLEKENSH
jgi:tetratricopeptide (TPR) repeat protein